MPPGRSEAVRAGIYCRISLAAIGDTTKTDDQERICRELAARLGWEVTAVYTDRSRSAWRRDRKREDWERMLADVKAGRLGAIVVYHGDRLIRQPFDLELLLNLADAKGVKLAAPGGTRDLGSADDRFILRIEAAMACRESDNISRRKIAGYDRMRRAGQVRPGGRGGRAFGYEPGDAAVRAGEAAVIREACARVLAGESCGSIARDLTARGVRTTTGRPFTHAAITRTLARPRYAGLMPDGIAAASWPAILPRGDWEMLRAVLAAKAAGFGYATNTRRYLLSGIAECGPCGAPVRVRDQKGYECAAPGCRKVYRSVAHLDTYVTHWVTGWLARKDHPAPLADAASAAGRELAALTARRAETEAVIASLADHPGQRIDILARALASFDEKIAAARERLAGDGTRRLLGRYAGISAAQFAALPLGVRRELVRASCRVVILPSRRGPGFRERDVIVTQVTGHK